MSHGCVRRFDVLRFLLLYRESLPEKGLVAHSLVTSCVNAMSSGTPGRSVSRCRRSRCRSPERSRCSRGRRGSRSARIRPIHNHSGRLRESSCSSSMKIVVLGSPMRRICISPGTDCHLTMRLSAESGVASDLTK